MTYIILAIMKKQDERILALYFLYWQQGYTDRDIFYSIKEDIPSFSEKRYKEMTPYFFNYVRQQIKIKCDSGDYMIPKTPELEKEFIGLINAGLPYDKAARILNIPLITITDFWFKDPMFKARVNYAVEIANAKVVMALHKRATGWKTTLRTTATTRAKARKGTPTELIDNEGMAEYETVTEREELILPSVEAAKFWLINQDPDSWSLTGKGTKEGNKSEILDAIKQMTEYNDEDREELGIEE